MHSNHNNVISAHLIKQYANDVGMHIGTIDETNTKIMAIQREVQDLLDLSKAQLESIIKLHDKCDKKVKRKILKEAEDVLRLYTAILNVRAQTESQSSFKCVYAKTHYIRRVCNLSSQRLFNENNKNMED